MQLAGFGKADGLAHETLDARAHCQVFAFHWLRVPLPEDVTFGGELPGIRAPMLGEEARDPKGLQEGFQLQKHFIYASAKDLG